MVIDKVDFPEDLKKLDIKELNVLSNEIREILINKASIYGGHLGSNLGVVELTIALNYVFDLPNDKIIYDVSHQSYVHKILTGRKSAFIDEEKFNSITGYTNPKESIYDCFNIGHTSTSISLACGLAKGRDLKKTNENIIAVIGDASLDGGESFEALNYASELNSSLIVVVNDNNMSIPENYGGLNNLLTELRQNNGKVRNNYFESLGFEYIFVKDGHNIQNLINTFKKVKNTKHQVVIHCCTQKGKGYKFAEENREKWHWSHPFDISTGEYHKASSVPTENYGNIVGEYLINKIKEDSRVVAMTASVPAYIGFNSQRRKIAGDNYIDVGIAEQHGVTMAAAISKNGGKPIFVTGSSFYQRAYDQIEQEMCVNSCPVTLLVAFSGINGHNTDCHAGLFDIALLGNIPKLIYLAPTNKEEYIDMLDWSIEQSKFPVAIRIPWNGVYHSNKNLPHTYDNVKYSIENKGDTVAVIALGSFFQLGQDVVKRLYTEHNINATLINPRFITGIDENCLQGLKKKHKLVVTLEDSIISGGFGSRISQFYGCSEMKVINMGFSMDIPTMFNKEELLEKNGLTPNQIIDKIILNK